MAGLISSLFGGLRFPIPGQVMHPKYEAVSLKDPVGSSIQATTFPKENVSVKVHNVLGKGDSVVSGNYHATEDSLTGMQLISALIQGAEDKAQLMEKLNKIRDYDYVESTLRDLSTDVMTRSFDPNQSEFIVFNALNKDYVDLNEKVNQDIQSMKMYDMIMDVIDEFIFQGQYIFKMDYNAGELDDCVTQEFSLPAYSKGSMIKVFDINEGTLRDPANYLVLNLFSSHKKLKIQSESGSYYSLKLPRGLFSESIIPKIINLRLLEMIQPLIELQSIDEKTYYHIRFPPGKDVSEAYKECMNYEKLLKSMLSLDEVKDVDDIVDRVSSIKVIPLFGSQEEMRAQTVNKVNRIDLDQIKDLRDSISNSLKIKINGDNSTNVEYYKLVKRIRGAIKSSVHEFLINFIHQKYSIQLDPKDFEVVLPEVQGAEDLDAIDFINMHQSTYKDILALLETTTESVAKLSQNPLIDRDALIDSFSDKMMKITNTRIFKNSDMINSEIAEGKIDKDQVFNQNTTTEE